MKISVQTNEKKQIVDITDEVEKVLGKSMVNSGLCHLFLTHTTAALATADLDPGTDLDLLDAIEQLVPKLKYRHAHNPNHVKDHIASTLIGVELTIPFEGNKLILGTWQKVVLVELDGPRVRQIIVSLLANP